MSTMDSFPFERLSAMGNYFGLEPAVPDDGRTWRPVTDLVDRPEVLDAAIDRVAVRLGTSDRAIGASILFQGWAARLTSIYAGSMVLGTTVPDLAADRLHFHQPATGPVGLALAGGDLLDPEAGWRRVVGDHVEPLADAIRGRVRVGRRQLLGNAAASLAGSLDTLQRNGHARLGDLVVQPWADPVEFAGLGQWITTPDGLRFARTTCCLIERIPGKGRCGDCSLNWRDGGSP